MLTWATPLGVTLVCSAFMIYIYFVSAQFIYLLSILLKRRFAQKARLPVHGGPQYRIQLQQQQQQQQQKLQHTQTNKHKIKLFTKQVVFQFILKASSS